LGLSGSGRFVIYTVGFCGFGGCAYSGYVADRRTGRVSEIVCGAACPVVEVDDFPAAISRDGGLILAAADLGDSPGGEGELDVYLTDRRTGAVRPVAVALRGQQPDGYSTAAALSAYGRYALFNSTATNLVRGDTNGQTDVFVRDMQLGRTSRVSVGRNGAQASGGSSGVAVTPDGRFATFLSDATDLVPGDTNGKTDVFLRDRRSGTTERVSVGAGGAQADGDSGGGFLSDDGRIVAFDSAAGNLVPGDRNGKRDVFVRDRRAGTTERVSLGRNGKEANGDSHVTSLSPDGRLVVFGSDATNLVPADGNRVPDVFVYDRLTRTTERVSVSSRGVGGDGFSDGGVISADGRAVAFISDADNLIPHDSDAKADVFVRIR
jgi:Tol biopolymer transport system component